MKSIVVTLLMLLLCKYALSQSNLNGKFFYNIQSDYNQNDSSRIDVDVKCIYFEDSLMYSINYSTSENMNYYYYNTNWTIKHNIQETIKYFFSFNEIDAINYKTKVERNPISDRIIYGYNNHIITDTISCNFFVIDNLLFETYSEKWIWQKGKKEIYSAKKNEIFDVIQYKEFNMKYVAKNINKN